MAEGALYRVTADGLVAAIVRTPAGAKKYGQPIGSVIVPDVVPQVKAPKARVLGVSAPHKGHKPTSAELAAAVRAVKKSPVPRSWPGGSADDDTKTVVYLDAAGYNERPTVLSTDEFDAYQGKTLVDFNHNNRPEKLDEFWRGTEVPKSGTDPYANLTTAKPGEFFVGSGIYANGTHIGSKTTAKMFASETPHTNRSERLSGGGTLVRIKIHPDARVVQMTDIPNYDRMTPYEIVKWAVDHNYDIVGLYGTRDPVAGIAVLNRSVMVVEELKAALTAKPTYAVGSTVEWGAGGKYVQGEVLKVLDDVLLVRPPWGGPPLRLNPRRLKKITQEGAGDENSGRVASAGAPGEPGPDLSAGSTDDPGLAATASGLPAEGRSDLPAALGTRDPTLTAAGISWRWQLRDAKGQWVEMGSKVKWLSKGLSHTGRVIGSWNPGMAEVKDDDTGDKVNLPSTRLEVIPEPGTPIAPTPRMRGVIRDRPVGMVSEQLIADDLADLLPGEQFADLRKSLSEKIPYLYEVLPPYEEFDAVILRDIYDELDNLGLDSDEGASLAKALKMRLLQTVHRETQWKMARGEQRQLAPKFNQMRQEQVAIAIDTESTLSFFKGGRYMTQFETATSHGDIDPIGRTIWESARLGTPIRMNPADRPIYGYVFTPDMVGSASTEQYGDVRMVLKPEVRSRTTMVAGDSLDGSAIPVPLEGPDLDAKEAFMATQGSQDAMNALAYGTTEGFQKEFYFEAQITGGVTVDDVAEILIAHRYNRSAADEAALRRIVQIAKGRGIPTRILPPPKGWDE